MTIDEKIQTQILNFRSLIKRNESHSNTEDKAVDLFREGSDFSNADIPIINFRQTPNLSDHDSSADGLYDDCEICAKIRKSGAQVENMYFDQLEQFDDSKIKIGRNDSCPCGSGKKYKKCCLDNPSKTNFE